MNRRNDREEPRTAAVTMPVRPVQAPAGTGITTCSLSMPSKSDDCVDVAVAARTGGGSRRRLTSRDSGNQFAAAGEEVLAGGVAPSLALARAVVPCPSSISAVSTAVTAAEETALERMAQLLTHGPPRRPVMRLVFTSQVQSGRGHGLAARAPALRPASN